MVRLFAKGNTQALWLKHAKDLRLSGRQVQGPIYVVHKDGKLHVYRAKRQLMVTRQLKIHSLDEMPYQIENRVRQRKWVTGELRLSVVQGQIRVVNRMAMEDYVAGILEGELGSLKLEPELLKAQIVVARSYVLSMRDARHHGAGYEFCDRPHCQVFRGVARKEEHPELEKILVSVRGQYLAYHGRPICAFYHHNCGGVTSAVEEVWPMPGRPYLKAVEEDPASICKVPRDSEWRVLLSRKKLTSCFRKAGWLKPKEALTDVQILETDPSGRVKRLLIQGQRPIRVSVGRFRNVINQYFGGEPLKSALFTLALGQEACTVRGRGWGHGVGFCQEGAKWLAQKGLSYRKILQHYFPHTALQKV